MITNYIVSSTACQWKERYLLPAHRAEMERINKIQEEHDFMPLLAIGDDGLWWNDDLLFILDRMSDGEGYQDPLRAFGKNCEEDPLEVGETRTIFVHGHSYSVTADETPMTHGNVTNDCEIVAGWND